MANNLRYLLEHFCLDGQKIDISSQLDEENANNIEKINTQTVPSINARIDDIKNTDIPSINSRIDSIKNTDIPNINQKINTINNTTIPNVQASVTAVNEKADRINESVAKNTRDIGTLSDNVTMQGNAINSIETEKIPSVENKVEIVAHETQRISKAHNHDIDGIDKSLSALHEETSNNTTNISNLTTNINELTTKVDTNTDSINELTTKVNTNTDSINTINNTSIPHLQSEIDNLSGSGSGSVGELREKVEKNTTDIAELNGKVETNTTAISTINDTSIPTLQSEIDNLKTSHSWKLLSSQESTKNKIKLSIKIYSNGVSYYAYMVYDFADATEIKLNLGYTFNINDIPLPTPDSTAFYSNTYFFADEVGFNSILKSDNHMLIALVMTSTPKFTSVLTTITSGVFYF